MMNRKGGADNMPEKVETTGKVENIDKLLTIGPIIIFLACLIMIMICPDWLAKIFFLIIGICSLWLLK